MRQTKRTGQTRPASNVLAYLDDQRPKVLVVGMGDRAMEIRQLPVRVIPARTGREAINLLRRHRVLAVLTSRWDLPDMPGGGLIPRVRACRPLIPVVVLVDELTPGREILARTLGAAVVLAGDTAPGRLRAALADLLRLEREPAAGGARPVPATRQQKAGVRLPNSGIAPEENGGH